MTEVKRERSMSWGSGKNRYGLPTEATDEFEFDVEAGDTPFIYSAAAMQHRDCFACCSKKDVAVPVFTMEDVYDERPFTSAIAIVRHGERLDHKDPQTWFRSELAQKYPFDCPLTDNGRVMARSVAEELRQSGLDFALVVCSPYLRCVQTAAEMCEVLDLQLCIDAELGEIFGPRTHGHWESTPSRRSLAELSDLVSIDGVPLLKSDRLVRNEEREFFGQPSTWPEALEDARLRMVSRVEQYLARSLQIRKNFVLVSHGDCVAASLGLLLSCQSGVRRVVTDINYCAYTVAQRPVDPADMVTLGLADSSAHWQVEFGNCQVSKFDSSFGDPWQGPYDPYPLKEEALRVREYENWKNLSNDADPCRLRRKKSTTILNSAITRKKSKDVLEAMEHFDVEYEALLSEVSV